MVTRIFYVSLSLFCVYTLVNTVVSESETTTERLYRDLPYKPKEVFIRFTDEGEFPIIDLGLEPLAHHVDRDEFSKFINDKVVEYDKKKINRH